GSTANAAVIATRFSPANRGSISHSGGFGFGGAKSVSAGVAALATGDHSVSFRFGDISRAFTRYRYSVSGLNPASLHSRSFRQPLLRDGSSTFSKKYSTGNRSSSAAPARIAIRVAETASGANS